MKSFLRLGHIEIENANAIAGMTYGFPAVTNFLGFAHALSRKLQKKKPILRLGACAIVAHQHQVHTYQSSPWKDSVFCLTRNPPTKEGIPAPFNEEGRMHLTVSLLLECHFTTDDLDEKAKEFEKYIKQLALTQRLAGGLITAIDEVKLVEPTEQPDERPQFIRQEMRKLLPGFLLVERSDLLAEHTARLQNESAEASTMDSWLDFIALKHQALLQEEANLNKGINIGWEMAPKPAPGWLVPITTGYRAISELYPPGKVKNARDSDTPFRFVEPAYTIGQWLSPHRVKDLEYIFWRYHARPEEGWYLCKNDYFPPEDNLDI